ncbi:MAG: N-acetylmuramoyl-L-alanine amidase [Mycobacteriales bacterium]
MHRAVRRAAALVAVGVVGLLVAAVSGAGARPAESRAVPGVSGERQREITAAAAEFGVPAPLLVALSAALTGWGTSTDPAVAGGHGLFRLADGPSRLDGHGPGGRAAAGPDPAAGTLAEAAALLHRPAGRVRDNPADNARGAAVLLRRYAQQATGGPVPRTLVGWYGAVARYGTGDSMTGRAFADDVFALLRTGVAPAVVSSQRFSVPARRDAVLPAAPGTGRGPAGEPPAQCPAGLDCRFVPAAGCTAAHRTPAAATRTVVVTDAPAGYPATVVTAQLPSSRWSPHYVVRARDGAVTQTVRLEDVAWHAGNPTVNADSVGIAVEQGPAGPTPAAYRSVSRLLRWLAGRGLALDRRHVLGGGEVPGAPLRLDPAWDWSRVLAAAGAPLRAEAYRADRVVTVAAPGALLRQAPAGDAAVLPDQPAVGRSLAVAERRGEWTAVWYGGRPAWLHDPAGRLTLPGDAERVTPVPGRPEVPVFGSVAGPVPVPLPARMLAGQAYVLLDASAVTAPAGAYLAVGFGARIAFVRAGDVALAGLTG